MTDRVFKVRAPTGELVEVTAPEEASDEQIVQLAQKQTAPTKQATSAPKEEVTPKGTGFLENLKPEFLGGFSDAVTSIGNKAGGAVTDKLAPHVPPEVAAGAGYVANVAAQTVPTLMGGLGGKAVEPIAQSGARKLMHGALKPSAKAQDTGKAAKAIETMLKEGINVSEGGVAKLRGHISDLSKEVASHIAASPNVVNKNAAAQELQLALNKFERTATPQANIRTITDAWTDFINHPLLQGSNAIPVKLAQEIKQGTQYLARNSYGELKGAEIEAQKMLARGLRKEIERVVPEVAKLNAKESELINAKILAEARIFGEKNKDPGGMVWLANNPAQALGWLASRSSWLKSVLARGLYKGAPSAGAAAGGAYGANVVGADE